VRAAFFASQLAKAVIVRSSAARHGLIFLRPARVHKPPGRSKQPDFMRVAIACAQLQDVLMRSWCPPHDRCSPHRVNSNLGVSENQELT
jgi:hypothetical protein